MYIHIYTYMYTLSDGKDFNCWKKNISFANCAT